MAEIKRHFYNGTHYEVDEQNKVVKLLPEFHQKLLKKNLWGKFGFKKIGGSTIGNVICDGMFYSPFDAFCSISWLGLPILDRKYVDAGIHIEPLVMQKFKKMMLEKQGREVDIKTFKPEDIDFDYFKNIDDVIGGIPDGILQTPVDQVIIEIKTTGEKNETTWDSFGIPESYIKQCELYTYLNKSSRYIIIATFLKDSDYKNLENYPVNERHFRIYKSWEDNKKPKIAKFDRDRIEREIKQLKEIYSNWTKSGVSPEYNPNRDADLLAWLKCKSKDEWEELKQKWLQEGKIPVEVE